LGSADEGEEEEEEDDLADDGNILDDTIDDAPGDNESGNAAAKEGGALNETAEGAATDAESELQSEQRITPGAGVKNDFEGKGLSGVEGGLTEGSEGVVDESAFEEINFGGDSGTDDDGKGDERQKDLFGDAEIDPAGKKASSSAYPSATSSGGRAQADGGKANNETKQQHQNAPSSSNLGAALRNMGGGNNGNAPVVAGGGGASLKELRKLRRHVLQLNSDLESAEREIEAQRQELDRAASRMERDRSRHKQEKEAADSSHKAEVVALSASHERGMRQMKETNETALREMESRVARAEQQRAKEGGERDADLADALERERMAVAATARLQEERTTLNERITSLTNETSRLETRLEHATSQMELASERERNAEEQLDKALSLHARQLGVRQRRESELEQTVADLAAALMVAKSKVEAAMKAGTILDGGQGSLNNPDAEEDPLDLKARLQDSQDEIETLRAQVSLERRRCSTLHKELQDLSKEQNDELSAAHATQRQYERKISDLTTIVDKLQSSLRRAAPGEVGDDGDIDGTTVEEFTSSSGVQYSGDEKKETDHLRKQISSLSEKIFEQQSRIDHGRGEISTLKNRLRSALLKVETAEKSLEVANQRLIMMDVPMSGMSSTDEEFGLPMGRAAIKRPPFGGEKHRSGFQRTSKVESIRSALGLHPGRFPSGGWQEMIASLLDTFDALSVDLGSHFRHYPMSRLAFMMYLLILHMWAFFLLVYHAHAQGTGGEHGPEAMMRSYHYEQDVPKMATAANVTSP
jgi:predicted  nucleic acid-binding Zn-ribbon protein